MGCYVHSSLAAGSYVLALTHDEVYLVILNKVASRSRKYSRDDAESAFERRCLTLWPGWRPHGPRVNLQRTFERLINFKWR